MGRTLAEGFCSNLTKLKRLSINWAKEKYKRDDQTLGEIEQTLATLLDDQGWGFTSTEAKTQLINLENQRSKILKEMEKTWRLQS